jgi:hypothetical protein
MKPRLSITLEAEDLAVLDRYAAATGAPRSSMVSALVSSAVPQLNRAAQLIELANNAPRAVLQGVVEDLSNATADAMGFLKPFDNDYQMVLNGLEEVLVRRNKRPPTAPRADAPASPGGRRPRPRPPPTNRGVKT